jgi:hypothetical protein
MEVFMKRLRKYANMALLLVLVTAIVPVHANSEIAVEPKKTETVKWYKRPEVRERAEKVFEAVCIVGYGIGVLGLMYYSIPIVAKSMMQPCTICKDNEFHGEVAKVCSKYGVKQYRLIF